VVVEQEPGVEVGGVGNHIHHKLVYPVESNYTCFLCVTHDIG
jgi:hypothetical protein